MQEWPPDPPVKLACAAILFDLDGVLVDSSVVVERHWRRWAESHQVPFDTLRQVMHGRTSAGLIRAVAPHLDAEQEGRLRETEEGIDTEGLYAPWLRSATTIAGAVIFDAQTRKKK
jgi:sugar-phosphatase